MQSEKLKRKCAVLVPCYRRPEYTRKCLESLTEAQGYAGVHFYMVDDGSNDDTAQLLYDCTLPKTVVVNHYNLGLRNVTISFFDYVRRNNFDYIAKVDNDCMVPKNWLNDLIKTFESSDVEVLSLNVEPSNAAFHYGTDDVDGKGYRPAEIVGGLWMMRSGIINDMDFERHNVNGLIGVLSILKQIVVEKEPRVGWQPKVVFQDIGHWSGRHPDHIKSVEHELYSKEVGRQIAWKA